ncbi:peptidase M20 [Rhizobium sp. Root149]|uniref:amidohydrolase n=1 Tax=Rhizobium sp. Root149 TaxID=1736473 RepID=UPI0007126F34|nr:amidohydrolase [Rhizobium sp. Root149]KQZ54721.1 peptidase M20 [Rhizobium sp. Root149]
MSTSDTDLTDLIMWRRHLHTMPEVSGEEHQTAAEVVRFLQASSPDEIVTGLGGTGVAAVFNGREPGPTVLFRAELDALPIAEVTEVAHRSKITGKGHMCGHDGHMAMVAGLSRAFRRERPASGRVILLFQPAEETGAGAAAVIADPAFKAIKPDFAFSLHNIPGLPLGHSWIKSGPVNCASCGLRIALTGKTAHASSPESGTSPAPAIAELIPALTALRKGHIETEDLVLTTVTHVAVGEPTFGVAPGDAELWVTLRTVSDDGMSELREAAEGLARTLAEKHQLGVSFSYHDEFRHCRNDEEAVDIIRRALDKEDLPHSTGQMFKFSEDFGRFGDAAKAAMFFIGAGENQPALHNPDYDFPDALIPIGGRIFLRIAKELLG